MMCSLGSFCSILIIFQRNALINVTWIATRHTSLRNFFNLHFYQDSIKSLFSIKPLFFPAKMKKVNLPLDLIYKCWCTAVVFVFSQCFLTVKVNLEKTAEGRIKLYARSSFFSANFISVVYGSGAHNQQKVKYKQLLNLTVSLGWKVVSTRHPQPWQKKGGRNNGFQGEMIGGCPINLQQESRWGLAMLCTSSFWYFMSWLELCI